MRLEERGFAKKRGDNANGGARTWVLTAFLKAVLAEEAEAWAAIRSGSGAHPSGKSNGAIACAPFHE